MIYNGLITLRLCGFPFSKIRLFQPSTALSLVAVEDMKLVVEEKFDIEAVEDMVAGCRLLVFSFDNDVMNYYYAC